MKRFFCMLLTLAIMGGLAGCGRSSANTIKPVKFYYCAEVITYEDSNSIFVPEVRETNGLSDLVVLMNNYVKGPESQGLVSPFPSTLEVIAIKEIGGTLDVTFSKQLSRLTGSDLTLACVCTALTLFDLKEAESVLISAEGVLLDGKEMILITPDRLSFMDTQQPESKP